MAGEVERVREAVPVVLRRELDAAALCACDACDASFVLGSFWPNSRTSFESHLVKSFKECWPVEPFEPHITTLCEFYCDMILRVTSAERFDAVARVLSSSEKSAERSRPQESLARILCERLGASNVTRVFYRSEMRPPMRSVKRLSGPDALEARIDYILQDLFMRPEHIGGSVLLVDDICNVGASARVYGAALRRFAGAERVVMVNLAATRFAGGNDGRGALRLDVSGLQGRPSLRPIWEDRAGHFHSTQKCSLASPPVTCVPRFAAEIRCGPCAVCCPRKKRKWWQVWRFPE